MSSPQEGAIGVQILYTVRNASNGAARDISAATGLKYIFLKPDGSKIEKTPIFATDGTNGVLKYVTIAGDLTPAGTWKLQPDFVLQGYDGPIEVVQFRVHPNL